MQNKIVAKVLVLNDAGQLLLLRRSKTDTNRPGDWDYPGGMVDLGEDVTEAAVREIQEEIGITVLLADMKLVFTATDVYDDAVNVVRLLYVVKTGATDLKLSYEHDHYEWLTPEDAVVKFEHPVWGEGLKHALEHDLLPK